MIYRTRAHEAGAVLRGPLWIVLVAFAFAGVAAEVGLRSVRPVAYRQVPERPADWTELLHRASDIPGLAYELAPNRTVTFGAMTVTTNGLGMRDSEPGPRADGDLRIGVLGDSITFGYGVAAGDSYPALLEQTLRDPPLPDGQRADVLNFGVSGYATRDELQLLAGRAVNLDLDLVIVGYSLNDPDLEPTQPLRAHFEKRAWWEYSDLLRLVAQARHEADLRRVGGGDYYRYLHHEDGESWPAVARSFEEMGRLAEQRGFALVLALFPTFFGYQAWNGYPYRDLHEQVAAAASRAGFTTLDLLEVFEASGSPPAALSMDLEHPNEKGHALAASALAEVIRSWYSASAVKPAKR